MTCPLCGKRPARRACPAKGTTICPTCCATKRLREIACPLDCPYLATARAHPPATLKRQRERDIAMLVAMLRGLDERQVGLISLVTAAISRHRAAATPRPLDADVTAAAQAQAATLDTASKGILYEHQPASLPAQRLVRLFRELLGQVESKQPLPSREAAEVFRRLEAGPGIAARTGLEGETALLDALDRLRQQEEASRAERQPGSAGPESPQEPRIVLP